MKGPSGEVRCGYQLAAQLGAWQATPKDAETLSFSAAVARCDEYWILQEPLSVALRFGRIWWVWDGVAVTRAGPDVQADLRGRPRVER